MKIFAYKTENILNVCFITWSKNNNYNASLAYKTKALKLI